MKVISNSSAPSKPIVLIGFMGTGKTRVGRILARRLGWRLMDTDQMVKEAAGAGIPVLVNKKGWPLFRRMEMMALRKALRRRRVVVAIGGGALLTAANRALIRKKGIIVHLSASAKTVWQRVQGSKSRPLITGRPRWHVIQLMAARRRLYNGAAFQVKTDQRSPEEVALAILRRCLTGRFERRRSPNEKDKDQRDSASL